MEVVSEGSLESISRPPSTSKRSTSSRSSIRSSSVQGSLDILPPEDPLSVVELEGEEDIVVTDYGDDDKNKKGTYMQVEIYSDHQNLYSSDQICGDQKTVTKEDAESEADKLKKLNSATESEANSVVDSQEFVDIDPKIKKGMEKIKKLDKILTEKIKKEKEVKKKRLDQERLWREHIENLEQNRDAELGKQVDLGPAHMLALGAPEDFDHSLYEESPPVTPLFATQPIVDEEVLVHNTCNSHLQQRHNIADGAKKGMSNNTGGDDTESSKTSDEPFHDGEQTEQNKNERRRNKKNKRTGRKDYIKRNIQLAADANNTIAMTEEEKKRLDELLSDMGNLMDEASDKEVASLSFYGDGFQPSADEAKLLADIDIQLQALLPAEEYNVLCQSSRTEHTNSSPIQTPRSEATNGTLAEESQTFGELVLHETKEMREMKERLLAIEEQLDRFQNLDHNEGVLSEALLRQLVDGSSRTTSQATTIFDRISSVASSVTCDTSFDNASCSTETPLIVSLEQ